MELTDQDIARRKELLGLGNEEAELLANCRPIIESEIDFVVHEFYRIQTRNPEVVRLMGDEEAVKRLHVTQRQYMLDLFSGCMDSQYVSHRLRIGIVHKNKGVDPKFYLAAVKTLKDLLFGALEKHITDRALLERSTLALDKLLYFDITLVFDAYTLSLVQEVEAERDRVEVYAESLEVQVAERTRELAVKVDELETALSMVKKLEGVIPICGVCKKIRDDKESWQQLEKYISEHSEALFSHGLCPECYEKEMMELRALKLRKQE